jgi:NitT/TauT family transport system permease protein
MATKKRSTKEQDRKRFRLHAKPSPEQRAAEAATIRHPGQRAARRFVGTRYRWVAAWTIPVLAIGAWWFVTTTGRIERFFLPPPADTLRTAVQLFSSVEFWSDLVLSISRICGGFLLACALAFPIGIWMGRSRFFNSVIEPPISFIRFVPMPAVIPLMILWFGSGEWGKVVIICLGIFFQLVLMIADAVASVPEAYYDIAHSVQATPWQRLVYFTIPSSGPEIWDSLRINIGLAWATLIFAEILGATSGLGYLIVRSQRYLLTENIFVAVLVIGVLGVITDKLFGWYYYRRFPWSAEVQRAEARQ